jgi:hypothetical protein
MPAVAAAVPILELAELAAPAAVAQDQDQARTETMER